MVKKIILDTNFLIICVDFGIDIIQEFERTLGKYELYIFDETISELEVLLNKNKGKLKQNIKIVISIIKHLKKTKDLKILSSKNHEYLDDLLVNFLKLDKDYFVATNDKELQKRVLDISLGVIYVRQKKYFNIKTRVV